MGLIMVVRALLPLLIITYTLAEKQIKLEDIEKDNLRAAEQAKIEKQYQKYQSNYQKLQYQYQPQYQTQYQTPAHYQTQSTAEYQTQSSPQYSTQSSPQYSTQSASIYSTQPAPQYTTSSAPQYQTQSSPQYSTHSTPQYQTQSSPHFTQEAALSYQEPSVTYQSHSTPPTSGGHSHYSPYVLPFNPNQLLSMIQGNYAQIPSNSLEASQASPPPASAQQHPFLQYFSQQLQPVAVSTGPRASSSHQAPVVMAFSSPSLAAFQQQAAAYYQGLPAYLQQASPSTGPQQFPYYLQQQNQQSTPLMYTQQQQYVPPFQALKIPAETSLPQYSQTYRGFETPSQYTQAYSQTEEPPRTHESPLKSSSLSQQQYLHSQATATTTSPLKYNSPQYLAQHYNTIQNSAAYSKSLYSKPSSPIVKVATQGGFLPNNPTGLNYQYSRSISG